MWPFNRKKKKEVKPTVSEKEVLDAIQRKRQEINLVRRERQQELSRLTPLEKHTENDILTDPLLSPLSPISPFSIWPNEDDNRGHHSDHSNHDSGGSSYDYGSSHDSGSYDSGSSDCGGSSGGGD